MDSIDAANKLVKEFGVEQGDALKAIDAEIDDLRNDPFHGGRKPTYREALDRAYESVREWLKTGDEYVIDLNWLDLSRFTHSHRKACVWAVLTAKHMALCGRCGMKKDHYFHSPADSCKRSGGCLAPEDHHEFTNPFKVSASPVLAE